MTKNDSWGQVLHERKNWQPDSDNAIHQQERDLYMLSRREMLALMGTLLTAALAGWRREWTALSTASAADLPSCVVRPEQTEGPYFIDEKLNRSDIRSDPSDGSIKPGAPLHLAFQVSRIDGRSCEPLPNAVVDIWHCDALGMYSDVRDQGFDTRGKKFLRGYQTTDANGVVEFLTIYPGWYAGRAVHIHFKIRTASTSRRAHEFTSQLYFDESVTDKVHAQAPYVSKGRRNTPNDKDFIFRKSGKQLMPVLTKEAQGYGAKFDIGLKIT